ANTNQSEKPTLAIASTGEAVVAWAQPDVAGGPLSVYVTRWNGSAWSTAKTIENSAETVVTNWQQNSRAISVAMRGSQAAIAWMQHQPTGSTLYSNSDLMVSRWNGTNWDRAEGTSQLANGWGEYFGAVGIDGQGNTFAAYNNLDGTWQTHIVHTETGNVTTFDYDNMDAVVRTVRAYGTNEARANEAKYDKLGRVVKELTAEGRALITASTPQTEIDRIWIDYATTYTYDNAGRRVTSSQRVSGTSTLLTTRYYYDADGRLRFVVDAGGLVRETQYDALGNVSANIG